MTLACSVDPHLAALDMLPDALLNSVNPACNLDGEHSDQTVLAQLHGGPLCGMCQDCGWCYSSWTVACHALCQRHQG